VAPAYASPLTVSEVHGIRISSQKAVEPAGVERAPVIWLPPEPPEPPEPHAAMKKGIAIAIAAVSVNLLSIVFILMSVSIIVFNARGSKPFASFHLVI
jgi:hypothetical protein